MGWLLWHPHLKDRFHWTRPLSLCLLVWDPCIFFVSSPSYIYIYTPFFQTYLLFFYIKVVVALRSLPTLDRLTLGKGFHQPLPAGALPATLRALTLRCPLDLSEVLLPERLQELTAGPKVNGMEKVTFPRRAVDFWEMNILKKVA